MDKPFRFSAYLRLFLRRWPLIVIPPLLAIIVAAIVSALTPPRYSATVTLIAPKPDQIWRWESRIYDLVDARYDSRFDYMPLVTTTAVAQKALDAVNDQLSASMSAAQLLAATSTKDGEGGLFTITVRAGNATDAALLANALAAALPAAIADYYGGSVAPYEAALATAVQTQEGWDAKLEQLRGETGINFGFSSDLAARGDNELFGAHNNIMQELVLKNSYRAALQDAIDRIDLILKTSEADPQSASVTLLNVPEIRTFGATYEELSALMATNPAGALARLRDLRSAMSADLDLLSKVTIERQYDLAGTLRQSESMLRDRGVWLESVTSLERKIAEVQFKRIVEGQRVRVVDPAAPSPRRSQPNWLLNMIIAGFVGLLGGFLLAALSTYLGDEQP